MTDPVITPAQHDGCSAPARTLNTQLQRLIGARYSPLPNQQGLAVLDKQGKRVATLFWEQIAVPQGAEAGDGEHRQADQHQRHQTPEQEPVRTHAGSVAQRAGQGEGRAG